MEFAPQAFRSTRVKTTEHVKAALLATRDLRHLDAATLRANPSALPTLRMCTAPPLAVDRLVGLAGASKSLIGSMEEGKLSARMKAELLDENLGKVCRVLTKLLDRDIFPWLDAGKDPTDHERDRASTIVADRLCSAVAKDIVRSARRKHQLAVVAEYLESRGYCRCRHAMDQQYTITLPGMYEFGVSLPLTMGTYDRATFDVLIQRKNSPFGGMPILLDVRSSETTTAARDCRDADAKKLHDLRMTYGELVPYSLMLGGSFDPGYLGTQAAEGIDWVWQHRLHDLDPLVT
ncbi:MAG: XamI family restriction endonuclease [Phycisphaerales bacterium]|nr:XamI family restriction endonuclease [Phycisphaerales bacterium]